MRLSVRENDSGFREDAFYYQVLLDGLLLDNCFTADEELGIVHVYEKDEHGCLKHDPVHGGPVERQLNGEVRIFKA